MTIQKMSAFDASFLHLETKSIHMHIGGMAIFEPSPVGTGEKLFDAIVAAIEPRLDLIPRYRQRIALVPLRLDTPVWVDDDKFDIRHHLHHAALPAPGGDKELQEFVGRVFSRQLDRNRPLWDLYIIEGLKDGKWALLSKTHHAMVDGVSNLELATLLLDTDPEIRTSPDGGSRWKPSHAPSSFGLLVESVRSRLAHPAQVLSAARTVVENPKQLADALRDTASGMAVMARTVRVPKSVINGPSGSSRRIAYSRFPLEDFRTIKNNLGGTINDVVLAAVTGGLRKFLVSRGVDPDEQTIQALCPVSIRDTSERMALGNRLSMMLVRLPITEGTPKRRLSAVHKTVNSLKARKQAVAADFLLNLAGFSPPTLHAMVARASLRQIGFNLVVTNIPGPQFPLYCQGARMVEVFPIAFLYEGQQLSIAVFSYCGQLNFGYVADQRSVPDIDVLVKSVEKEVQALLAAAKKAEAGDDLEINGKPSRTLPRRKTAAGA